MSLKDRIHAGETLRGLWQTLPGPEAAEVAVRAGFDWLVIDGEHGPWDPGDIRRRLIAAPEAVVRVPVGEDWVIKQALDLGARAILVPMVNDAAQARSVVAACRFPPEGVRGVGAFAARAGMYGLDPEAVASANRDISIWVQVESRAAVDNLEAICGVPGLDCVFIGPADLAADMGTATTNPTFQTHLEEIIARIAATGVAPGIFAADPERWVAAGARVVTLGCDGMVLAAGLRALL